MDVIWGGRVSLFKTIQYGGESSVSDVIPMWLHAWGFSHLHFITLHVDCCHRNTLYVGLLLFCTFVYIWKLRQLLLWSKWAAPQQMIQHLQYTFLCKSEAQYAAQKCAIKLEWYNIKDCCSDPPRLLWMWWFFDVSFNVTRRQPTVITVKKIGKKKSSHISLVFCLYTSICGVCEPALEQYLSGCIPQCTKTCLSFRITGRIHSSKNKLWWWVL